MTGGEWLQVTQQPRGLVDLRDEAGAGVACSSVLHGEALVAEADDRSGLRARKPSVLREPAFEFSCCWLMGRCRCLELSADNP
jgi:hypothetical protein